MIQCNWTLRLDEHEHLPCIHHVFPARLKDKSDRELNRIQQRRVLDMTCHQHRVGQRAEDFSRARSRLVFVSGQPGPGKVIHWPEVPGSSRSQHGVAVENCCRPPCVCRCCPYLRAPDRQQEKSESIPHFWLRPRPGRHQPSESVQHQPRAPAAFRRRRSGSRQPHCARPLMDVGEPLLLRI